MANYDTYREAVIANGSTKGVVTTCEYWTGSPWFEGKFTFDTKHERPDVGEGKWVKCNPADHLETLKSFLASGKRLVVGDKIVSINGLVISIKQHLKHVFNTPEDSDSERFILQAAADQVETPEEKEAFDRIPNQTTIDAMNSEAEKESYNSASEAFDAIDTTPQQVESLGKWIPKSGQTVYIAQINTLAGVKEERYFVVQFWCNSKHQREYLDCGILFPTKEEAEIKTKTMLGITIETPAEREERERDELAKQIMIDLCGEDVFDKRGWNYHKKFTEAANQAFKLVDLGYRKR